MRSSGHFRGTEGAGSFSVVAPDPDVAGATPVFFDSWSAPCSRARPCARGQLSFVLNRHLSVSQQPLPSLRSRSQEAQMRFSCLDATTYLSWPRCLEKPHGVTHETDFITDGPFTLLCTPESGAVALSRKSRRGAKRRSSHGRQVLYTRCCGTFFDGRLSRSSTLLPVLKATPFRGLLV